MEILIGFTLLDNSILSLLVININVPNVEFTIAGTTCQYKRVVWMKCQTWDTIWYINIDCWFHWVKISSKDIENCHHTLMLTPWNMISLTIPYSKGRSITRPGDCTSGEQLISFLSLWDYLLLSFVLAKLTWLVPSLGLLSIVIEIIVKVIIIVKATTLALFCIFLLLQSLLCGIVCFVEIKVGLQFIPHVSLVLSAIFPNHIVVIKNAARCIMVQKPTKFWPKLREELFETSDFVFCQRSDYIIFFIAILATLSITHLFGHVCSLASIISVEGMNIGLVVPIVILNSLHINIS